MVATTAPVCLAPRSTPPDGKMEAGSNVSAALRIAWPPGVAGVCVLMPMPQAWQVAVVRGFTTVHTLHCHAPPIRCRDAVVAMETVPAPAPAPGAMRTLALVPAASGASCSSSLDPSSMTVVMPSAWSKSSMRSPLCCKGTELGVASNCGSARASMYLRAAQMTVPQVSCATQPCIEAQDGTQTYQHQHARRVSGWCWYTRCTMFE